MEAIVWLALLAVFLIVEIITVGLTSIWLAGGALAALIVNILGLSMVWQIAAFFIVSFVLLIFTRPFAMKFVNSHHEKTNYEGIVGKVVRITQKVDNLNQTGKAEVNGQEWSVRAMNDREIFNPGDIVKVMNITGVKLIVVKYEEE